MVIVLYDQNADRIYICCPNEKTRVVSVDDPSLMDYIHSDDILYVTNGHYFSKQQFADYLSGKMAPAQCGTLDSVTSQDNRYEGFLDENLEGQQTQAQTQQTQAQIQPQIGPVSNKKYIHPVRNGTVLIEDIQTSKFPAGVALQGKYHFIAVDDIGEAELANSKFFELLVKHGKVKVVDEAYVKQHAHKFQHKKSPAEAALDKILIPAGPPGTAENVAAAGGINAFSSDAGDVDAAIPIYVN